MSEKKNVKIPAALHKRLKMYAAVKDRRVEELIAELLDKGLTELAEKADEPLKALLKGK